MTDQFTDPAAPGSGDRLPLADLLGTLLLFSVDEIVSDIETVHGTTDAIGCDVAVLDGTNKGDTYPGTLIFPKVLQGQLRGATGGGKVLGRLAQGERKPGKNPPWMLEPATEADKDIARKYLVHVAAQAVEEESPF